MPSPEEGVERTELEDTDGGHVNCWKPRWNTCWQYLQELNICIPYDPEIPLLDIQLKELKSKNRYLYSNVHIIIHNNQ